MLSRKNSVGIWPQISWNIFEPSTRWLRVPIFIRRDASFLLQLLLKVNHITSSSFFFYLIQNTLWDFLLTSLVHNTKRTRFSELFKLTVDCWQQRNNPAGIKFTLLIHLLAFWSLHSRSMHRCHLPCGCWGHILITLLETFDKRKIAWTQKKLTNKWEPLTHMRCFIQSM